MYFWNINQLKEDLKKEPLTELESFKYLFAHIILYTFSLLIPTEDNNMIDMCFYILSFVISLIGIYYVYLCNNGKNGYNFLQKYLSLDWVCTIRFLFFIFLIIFFLFVIFTIINLSDKTVQLLLGILFNIGLVIYYFRLGKHIKELS